MKLTIAEYRKLKRNKYGAIPTKYQGIRYASKLEAQCAGMLDALWAAGEISWYTRQVGFRLEGGVRYVTDFLVVGLPSDATAPLSIDNMVMLVDATGVMTSTKRNKLKQVHERYGLVTRIYRRNGELRPYLEIPVSR